MATAPNLAFAPAPEEWPEELVNLGRGTEGSARLPEQAGAAESTQDSSLNWLFVDFNSYFASCE